MEKETGIIRIADIARMAGVSVGTVDRVLHNRGKVSLENEAKIRAVLKTVNYQPNVLAKSLASKKQYHIVALIPAFVQGQYWESAADGVNRAREEFKAFNIRVSLMFFDQYDAASFDERAKDILAQEVDGVLIATLFTEMVSELSRRLDEREIPYVYIDADIPGNNRLSYFGTESYRCGLIAAKLMLEKIDADADILIARIANNGQMESTQRRNRKRGFYDYLAQMSFKGTIHNVELKLDDAHYNADELGRFFQTTSNVQGFTVFNSTCHLLGDYISRHPLPGKRILIGYDLIRPNTDLLAGGVVSALIAQRPESQGYHGVKSLAHYLLFARVPEPINLMPIDILIKENLTYYLDSKL